MASVNEKQLLGRIKRSLEQTRRAVDQVGIDVAKLEEGRSSGNGSTAAKKAGPTIAYVDMLVGKKREKGAKPAELRTYRAELMKRHGLTDPPAKPKRKPARKAKVGARR